MELEHSLHQVEQELAHISAAMLAADPLVLERSAAQLRAALGAFAVAAQSLQGQPWPAALQPRLQAVSQQLALQREQLARLGALVERQVASLLPPAEHAPATYGKSPGATAARIYRSVS
ncbi:MAG: hypothetical protein BGO74_15630 [Burkholderiales bacterium 68-12]|nr:hypothetical protein [Burkholderiales bacterium]OJX28504.1 MAG: hypothetical protein BGO74_15630 [Burkholderiales bacterium 68-12]